MVQINFGIVDYFVFSSLLVASALIGVYFMWTSRKTATNSEIFTGNRRLPIFPVVMSLVASFMSTNTLLGVPAEIYQVGTQYSVQIITIFIAVILAAEVFMPIYYRLELTSVHEYLALRFDSQAMRYVGTAGFLCATIPYMAVVLYGPSLALSSVTPLGITTSILLVGLICTFYTAIGGIKAVIWTDVLQCILMFIGVIMVIIQGLIEVGGLQEVIDRAYEGDRIKFFNFKFNIYQHDTFWAVICGTFTTWCAIYCVMQTQVQRYCSMESLKIARGTLYYNLPGLALFACLAAMCGVVIYAKYHGCDPVRLGYIDRHDQLMPFFVMDTLSSLPGLAGLFVACAFSGSLSTLSSGFNSLAAVTWEDLLKDRVHVRSEKHAVWITRITALTYGLLAIALSFLVGRIGTVLQASLSTTGGLMSAMFAVYTLGIFCPFATARGTMVGALSGITFGLWISVGAVLYPRPKVSLETSIDNCTQYYLDGATIRDFNYVTFYEPPEGILQLYHISYLWVPFMCFLITLVIGGTLSLICGGRKPVDPAHLNGLALKLFPVCTKKSSELSLSPCQEPFNGHIINGVSGLAYAKKNGEVRFAEPVIRTNGKARSASIANGNCQRITSL